VRASLQLAQAERRAAALRGSERPNMVPERPAGPQGQGPVPRPEPVPPPAEAPVPPPAEAPVPPLRAEAPVPPPAEPPTSAGVTLPERPGQIQHIFRDAAGHVPDTAANRAILEGLANDTGAVLGADRFGNTWAAQLNADGTQTWVQYRNGVIINGGVNPTPRTFSPQTGLSGQ